MPQSTLDKYSTVQYSTIQCSTVQYSTEQYSTVQCSTVQYSTVQYSTVQYTVQYRTVQYSTVQYSGSHAHPVAAPGLEDALLVVTLGTGVSPALLLLLLPHLVLVGLAGVVVPAAGLVAAVAAVSHRVTDGRPAGGGGAGEGVQGGAEGEGEG